MADYTTINDPTVFFNTTLYVGTGASLGVTGVNFQPDSTWIKDRDTAYSHRWWNSAAGATKYLTPDNRDTEGTNVNGLASFDSDGFTVGSMASVGESTDNFVSWNWKMGTTSGIDTTGSTITPSAYTFNDTAKQSVVAYTGNGTSGALVAHGLGVAPDLIIVKQRDAGSTIWQVYFSPRGATKYLMLSETDTENASATRWNDTEPTSVNFSLGNSTYVNGNTSTYIAYCFSNVQGYQRCGQYEGNNNADCTYVYTGFKPEFVMVKDVDAVRAWGMFYREAEADLGNMIDSYLLADDNAAEAESASNGIDFLSNGFKFRGAGALINAASTYVYIAFARAPFVNSSGIPITAH